MKSKTRGGKLRLDKSQTGGGKFRLERKVRLEEDNLDWSKVRLDEKSD
jgi:hypothetical protein